MLPKENRLVSKYEFNKTRYLANKQKTKISQKYFHVFWLDVNNYDGPSRIGIVISNKFHKSAAKRNKTKRVFREVIRSNLGKIKNGYWIVVHPKFISIDKSYEEINTDFNQVIQKVPFTR